MRRIISILLISLILVQTSNANTGDILQVKNLYQHAKFHQEAYGDSFFDFLSEHYGNQMQQHQDEHQDHKNLPLKHQHNSIDISVTVVPTSNCTIEDQPFIEIPLIFFYSESTSIFERKVLFQPPQFI